VATCVIADIRAVIYTSTLTDADIVAIISKSYNRVLAATGATDDSNLTIQEAIEYTAYALALRRMKTTGEQAPSITRGNSQQQNNVDIDIAAYETEAKYHINQYNISRYSSYTAVPSCHIGFEGHHHHHGGQS